MQHKKLKCVYCNYEMASKADKPRCYKCGSRKLDVIDNFSVLKPYKENKEAVKVAKTKEDEKPDLKIKESEKIEEIEEIEEIDDNDDINDDFWG